MESKLTLHRLFQSGMVLLQNADNCISGYGNAGDEISLSFRDAVHTASVAADGTWSIMFNPGPAGGPFVMDVASRNPSVVEQAGPAEEIRLVDVYVGEVWVGSGQSNMQLQMERLKYTYPEEYSAPEIPELRFFTVPIAYGFSGEASDLEGGQWVSAAPATVPAISGTAYFFAKSLWQALKVPVGFINASQGGSPIASWLGEAVLKKYPELLERLLLDKDERLVEEKKASVQKAGEAWRAALDAADEGIRERWDTDDFSTDVRVEEARIPGRVGSPDLAGTYWFTRVFVLSEEELSLCRAHGAGIWLGRITDSDDVWINGMHVGGTGYQYPPRRYAVPAECLVAGKNRITVRVVSSGFSGGIEFAAEKKYIFFAGNVLSPQFVKQLDGIWQCLKGCEIGKGGGEFFPEWEPAALYNRMLAPLFKTAVRGFVWYQGETDADQPEQYRSLLKDLIAQVRERFVNAPDAGVLPFMIAQLPNFGPKDMCAVQTGWPSFRLVQAEVADGDGHAGLAVLLDSGEWNDLHPENKRAVGSRLAGEALRIAYGRQVPSSPRMAEVVAAEPDELVARFMTDGSALRTTAPDGCVEGFSAVFRNDAGTEVERRVSAALSDASSVVVKLDPVPEGMRAVRLNYLMASSPDQVTLYNEAGLPARPFSAALK